MLYSIFFFFLVHTINRNFPCRENIQRRAVKCEAKHEQYIYFFNIQLNSVLNVFFFFFFAIVFMCSCK